MQTVLLLQVGVLGLGVAGIVSGLLFGGVIKLDSKSGLWPDLIVQRFLHSAVSIFTLTPSLNICSMLALAHYSLASNKSERLCCLPNVCPVLSDKWGMSISQPLQKILIRHCRRKLRSVFGVLRNLFLYVFCLEDIILCKSGWHIKHQ